MKKLILVLALTSLMSCKKDDDSGCYDCTTETVTNSFNPNPNYPIITMLEFESCSGDKTSNESMSNPAGGVYAIATTTCNKK